MRYGLIFLFLITACSDDVGERMLTPFVKPFIQAYDRAKNNNEEKFFTCKTVLPYFPQYSVKVHSLVNGMKFSRLDIYYKDQLLYAIIDFSNKIKVHIIGAGKWSFNFKKGENSLLVKYLKKEKKDIELQTVEQINDSLFSLEPDELLAYDQKFKEELSAEYKYMIEQVEELPLDLPLEFVTECFLEDSREQN